MKSLLIPLLCLAAPSAALAQADGDISSMLATTGIAATEAALAAVTDPTPSQQFGLGGVRFLSAIEAALQTRYRTGMSGNLTMMADLPILRLPIPDNPAPEPFDPAVVQQLFETVASDLGAAITALDAISDADAVLVTINTADIWFDINMNGARDQGEGLGDVAGFLLSGGFGGPAVDVTIAFDTADAAWLSAYAHLLSGVSDLVLAFSPTDTITRVLDAAAAMEALAPVLPDPENWLDLSQFGDLADIAAIIIGALEQQPDADMTRAAHAHFLAMIADNRTFWARVATETDNNAEWIPNKKQQSALPIPFPTDTGARWQAVLADAEALLNGDLLIPHWRLGDSAGVNLATLFQDPPVVDIIGMIQGVTLLPYMQQGRRINADSLMAFEQLMQGDAGLYMIVLN